MWVNGYFRRLFCCSGGSIGGRGEAVVEYMCGRVVLGFFILGSFDVSKRMRFFILVRFFISFLFVRFF